MQTPDLFRSLFDKHRRTGLMGAAILPALMAALPLGLASPVTAQSASAAAKPGPVVAVTGGKVQGRWLAGPGGAVFKGIPYAAPPVGKLRWRETQPVKPWKGIVQAGDYRPGCGQAPTGGDNPAGGVEDCLYLNVWAPQWPARTKQPVMLWINGGELAGGSGSLRAGVESLARHGVILVSLNYRGTLLGMMGHPELTAESPHKAAAGYGSFDQLAALHWIRANIARFGGDPSNVTVFGQSGGAHMISMLLASPQTKGLIHKAIIHSGAPMQSVRPYLTKRELERIGEVTADVLGAPKTGTIDYLRSLPAAKVVPAMAEVRTRLLKNGGAAYDQGADGYIVPRAPNEVWAAHQELRIPLMIGSTSQDTMAAVAGIVPPDQHGAPDAVSAYQRQLVEVFYREDADLAQRAMQAYGLVPGPNGVSTYAPYGSPLQQQTTDLNHRCSALMSAALHSAIAPTWVYEFSRSTPGHLPSHSSELRYVFGFTDLEDDAARKQSDIIQTYWTNFAKTGNPNGPGVPQWGSFEPAKKASIELAQDGPIARSAIREQACAPYAEKYTRHPGLLSNGENLMIRGIGGNR
ncbi:carboxylesterase family protein [Novosphingobium flavum]|uniref:Carboxylic ester hydrolase n=1 Tax=Novosphingobium flavum TaxID=1778672 RepID=A0A7X1KMA6_9SPHN|nr:carboxylesterase family protein [Novosphingobium flavum]MBC2666105.1 carboxylesterase family protein [Novosphingobium flavum]